MLISMTKILITYIRCAMFHVEKNSTAYFLGAAQWDLLKILLQKVRFFQNTLRSSLFWVLDVRKGDFTQI